MGARRLDREDVHIGVVGRSWRQSALCGPDATAKPRELNRREPVLVPRLEIGGGLDLNRGPIRRQHIVRMPLDSQSGRADRLRHQELSQVAASIVHPEIGQSETPAIHDRGIRSGPTSSSETVA